MEVLKRALEFESFVGHALSIALIAVLSVASSTVVSAPLENIPALLAVNGPLPPLSPLSPLSPGVTDLKFAEMFKMPVGPRGLEPTDKLLGLNGKRVRMVGFMVRQDVPSSGMFIFAAQPLELGDEDESLSDDLPPSAVFVHIGKPADAKVAHVPALIKLTGILQLGSSDEIDGHVSTVRLLLDDSPARALVNNGSPRAKSVRRAKSSSNASASIQ